MCSLSAVLLHPAYHRAPLQVLGVVVLSPEIPVLPSFYASEEKGKKKEVFLVNISVVI